MIELIDQLTQGFLSRYNTDVKAAEGAFLLALDSPSIGSARDDWDLIRRVQFETQAFDTNEMRRYLASARSNLLTRAFGFDGNIPVDFYDLAHVMMEEVVTKIAGQKSRDQHYLIRRYRELVNRAHMISRSKGWSLRASVIAAKEKQGKLVRFTAMDRSGKRWDSERYVRTTLRHALLTLYNEAVLSDLMYRGKTTAVVKHVDPNHATHNKEFHIIDDYLDIRDAYFHPNSNAVVAESK